LGCWIFMSKRPKLMARVIRRWITFINRSVFVRLSPHLRCNQTAIVQTNVTKILREWVRPVCEYVIEVGRQCIQYALLSS
jgi:hypothetical protein